MFARPTAEAPVATRGPAGFPFSRALPLGQLVLCAILLWPIRGRIFAEFFLPLRMIRPPLVFQYGGPAAQRVSEWSLNNSMDIVAILNLPAGLVQLPYAVFSADHREPMPHGVDSKVWRAITWPLLGMVFWWVAGRGAEALAAAKRQRLAPRIRWPETIVGFVLLAGGVGFAVGFVFFAGPDRHVSTLQVLAAVATLWAFLGGLSVAARIAQRRLRKRLATDQSV